MPRTPGGRLAYRVNHAAPGARGTVDLTVEGCHPVHSAGWVWGRVVDILWESYNDDMEDRTMAEHCDLCQAFDSEPAHHPERFAFRAQVLEFPHHPSGHYHFRVRVWVLDGAEWEFHLDHWDRCLAHLRGPPQ